jgi:hypothetical protein
MANSNGWGDGSANNTIGWGKGAINSINWGKSHSLSNAGLTNIVGSTQSNGTAPPQATAPFIIDIPRLSVISICANSANSVKINNMVWGGYPTPTITYSWFQVDASGNYPDSAIGQYTDTLYLDFAYAEQYLYCLITATNDSGVSVQRTELVNATDCS